MKTLKKDLLKGKRWKPIQDFYSALLNSGEPQYMLLRLLLAGLFIRLCVMPFFCHPDFLSEYRRIHLQVMEFNFFPGARFIVTIVESLNYALAYLLVPGMSSMFYMPPESIATAGHQEFFIFVSHPTVFRALFTLKLGYLLFDLLSAAVIFRFVLQVWDSKKAWMATAIWLFNPITIFSFYIFGRYESIALFFFLLSMLWFHNGRLLKASIAFSLCLWSREIFALVLPLFAIAMWLDPRSNWKGKLAGTLIMLFTIGCVSNVLPSAAGFSSVLTNAYGNIAAQSQIEHIIAFGINWYYPIIICYTLLAFYLITGSESIEDRLAKALLGFFLSFFTFSVHSVHYVAWLFPILCLNLPRSRHLLLAVIGYEISWVAYWLVATDLGVFTAWLAAPMSTHFLNFPNIPVWLAENMPEFTSMKPGHLVAIFKSVNVACLIFMAIEVFKPQKMMVSAPQPNHVK